MQLVFWWHATRLVPRYMYACAHTTYWFLHLSAHMAAVHYLLTPAKINFRRVTHYAFYSADSFSVRQWTCSRSVSCASDVRDQRRTLELFDVINNVCAWVTASWYSLYLLNNTVCNVNNALLFLLRSFFFKFTKRDNNDEVLWSRPNTKGTWLQNGYLPSCSKQGNYTEG